MWRWCDPCPGHEPRPDQRHVIVEMGADLISGEGFMGGEYLARWMQYHWEHFYARSSGYEVHVGEPFDFGRRKRVMMTALEVAE